MFDRFNFAQIAAPEVLAASTVEQRATFAAALTWLRANFKWWRFAAHYLYEPTPEREFPSLLIWRRELDEEGDEIESDRVLELEVARDGRCRWFCEGQFSEWGEWSSNAPLQAWVNAYASPFLVALLRVPGAKTFTGDPMDHHVIIRQKSFLAHAHAVTGQVFGRTWTCTDIDGVAAFVDAVCGAEAY